MAQCWTAWYVHQTIAFYVDLGWIADVWTAWAIPTTDDREITTSLGKRLLMILVRTNSEVSQ